MWGVYTSSVKKGQGLLMHVFSSYVFIFLFMTDLFITNTKDRPSIYYKLPLYKPRPLFVLAPIFFQIAEFPEKWKL